MAKLDSSYMSVIERVELDLVITNLLQITNASGMKAPILLDELEIY